MPYFFQHIFILKIIYLNLMSRIIFALFCKWKHFLNSIPFSIIKYKIKHPFFGNKILPRKGNESTWTACIPKYRFSGLGFVSMVTSRGHWALWEGRSGMCGLTEKDERDLTRVDTLEDVNFRDCGMKHGNLMKLKL